MEPDEVVGLRRGQALKCAEALRVPDGCGHGERCRDCRLRLALDACFAHGACPQQQELTLPLAGANEAEHEAVFEASFTYLKLAAGPQVLVSLFDITARKQMEEELREVTRFNEQVIDGAFDGIVVYGHDLRYLVWNRAMERITGVPAREVLGKHPRDCFPFLEAAGIIARLAGVLQGTPSQMEFEYTLPSGRRGWTQDTSSPMRDAEGTIIGAIAQVRETTARHAMEEKLFASEQRFRSVVENSPVLTTITDAQGRIEFVSPQCVEVIGWRAEDVLGVGFPDFIHPDDQAMVQAEQQRSVAGMPIRDFEYRILDPQGEIRWLSHSATLLKNADGTRVLSTIANVTARKAAEERLLQTGRLHAAGQLAAGVAHEFNNILQIIRSVVQMAESEEPDATVLQRERRQTIIAQTERGGSIARGMLAFARPAPPRRQHFPLAELVERVVKLQKQPLANENISVRVLIDDGLTAYADPGQLEQVLVNLLLNARHALHPKRGGSIRIAAHIRDGLLRLSVTDDGIGMSEEVRQKALLPFFTTKGGFSEEQRHEGSGLGLAIIDAIVRAHGGHCEIISAPGKGANFTIILPATAADSAPATVVPAGPPVPVNGILPARVLLVDDEEALQESIAMFLRGRGATVVCAGDGTTARTALADGIYDAVLLDLNLPQVTGIELVLEARQRQPQARCVVMTGVLDLDALSEELEKAGVSATLPKPFDLRQLLDLLRPG